MFAHYAKANFRDHDDNENVLMTSLDKLTMLLLIMTARAATLILLTMPAVLNHQYGNSDDSDIDDDDADVDDVGNLVDYHQR